jgi:hypothetical protein
MSIQETTRLEVPCPGCGAVLRVPAHAAGQTVSCPGCGAGVEVPGMRPDSEPLDLSLDEPGLASHKKAVVLAAKSESLALWLILGLISLAVAGYAIRRAYLPRPVVVQAPAPAPAPALAPAAAPSPAVHRPALRPSPRPRPVREEARPEVAPRRTVEVARDPDPVMRRRPRAPDGAESFENGAAFDNPTMPDRNGRPGMSTFENPASAPPSNFENPAHGYVSRRAPQPANRPNVPDPSFGPPR